MIFSSPVSILFRHIFCHRLIFLYYFYWFLWWIWIFKFTNHELCILQIISMRRFILWCVWIGIRIFLRRTGLPLCCLHVWRSDTWRHNLLLYRNSAWAWTQRRRANLIALALITHISHSADLCELPLIHEDALAVKAISLIELYQIIAQRLAQSIQLYQILLYFIQSYISPSQFFDRQFSILARSSCCLAHARYIATYSSFIILSHYLNGYGWIYAPP